MALDTYEGRKGGKKKGEKRTGKGGKKFGAHPYQMKKNRPGCFPAARDHSNITVNRKNGEQRIEARGERNDKGEGVIKKKEEPRFSSPYGQTVLR